MFENLFLPSGRQESAGFILAECCAVDWAPFITNGTGLQTELYNFIEKAVKNRSPSERLVLGRSCFQRTFPGVILVILRTQNLSAISILQHHKYSDVAVNSDQSGFA